MEDKKHILIVGAGIGGLATALRLVRRGYRVTIVEKNDQAGGRMNRICRDGFVFDTGPSFFSMSYEFHELAKDCGISLPFTAVPLDPLYTVHLRSQSTPFYLYRDLHRLSEQFVGIEPQFEKKIHRYLTKCADLYEDTIDKVVKRNFNSIPHYLATLLTVNPRHLPVLLRTFWQQVSCYFDSEEARQVLSLVAFFLGRTPFDTAGVYTLLSHVEFVHDGYYNVRGGMYEIVEGFIRILKQFGVSIVYDVEIRDFEATDRRVTAFVDQNGNRWSADGYVINADAAVFRGRILRDPAFDESRLEKKEWTMGYLTLYVGIDRKLPMVDHHNYYLGTNFRGYATGVMENPSLLEKPYYYVNVLSRHNPECAPAGCESLFFVCPVPNLLYKPDWDDREAIAESILSDFSRRIGVDLTPHVVTKTIYTPVEWENKFLLYKGSGLGLSHRMDQIGAFRPPNRDGYFRNVFYVGASTVPGAGIPMAVISSRLVVDRLESASWE